MGAIKIECHGTQNHRFSRDDRDGQHQPARPVGALGLRLAAREVLARTAQDQGLGRVEVLVEGHEQAPVA
jgi:hypothetical protein